MNSRTFITNSTGSSTTSGIIMTSWMSGWSGNSPTVMAKPMRVFLPMVVLLSSTHSSYPNLIRLLTAWIT